MRAVPRVGLRRLWSGSDLDYLVVLTMAGPTSEIRQILAQCGTTDIQVKMSNTLSYNNVRGVAQLGSAPALGAGGPRFESGRPDWCNWVLILWLHDTHLRYTGEASLCYSLRWAPNRAGIGREGRGSSQLARGMIWRSLVRRPPDPAHTRHRHGLKREMVRLARLQPHTP